MLGAIFGAKHSPSTKAAKSKSKNAAKRVAIVVHTSSPLENAQHMAKAPTDKHMMKENAKHTMRRATEDWVDGRITTKEHKAMHDRAKHVISGKEPREFKGPSGERSFKKMGLR